jgi:hypothetical protein
MLYIPLPSPEERAEIAAALIRTKPLAEGVDIRRIARDHCHGFSGADLSALVREAATNAIKVQMFLSSAAAEFSSRRIKWLGPYGEVLDLLVSVLISSILTRLHMGRAILESVAWKFCAFFRGLVASFGTIVGV